LESRLLLDSGAIVALERGDARTRERVRAAASLGVRIAVPTAVVAETWRAGARSARAAALLGDDCCDVEDLTQPLARAAGTALGQVRDAGAVDAMVMAHAAVRGDVVMTADYDDLDRLRHCDVMRAVRLLKV
jgi:predicted nucleic acid-binding protein